MTTGNSSPKPFRRCARIRRGEKAIRKALRKKHPKREIIQEIQVSCDDCDRFFGSYKDLKEHKDFCSEILFLKNESGVPEEEFEDEDWLDGLSTEYFARSYAESCLIYLNQKYPDRDYKLVKPGNYQTKGIIVHLNFKAKAYADNGPVHTFFAQLRSGPEPEYPGDVVHICKPLGLSEEMPHWKSAYLRDCRYCSYGVHHPYPDMGFDEKMILDSHHYYDTINNPLCRNQERLEREQEEQERRASDDFDSDSSF